MQYAIKYLYLIGLIPLLISCGSTKQLSKKALDERISKLENENTALKKDVQLLQQQVRQLKNALPKPGGRPSQGGARPSNEQGQVSQGATSIAFEKTVHDFGTVKEGESVEYTFVFTNTGKEPLKIESARGSCGCTVPQWPKEPIPAGAKGEIKVSFNSNGKRGKQHKSVTIKANTNPTHSRIYIKATVQQ